MHERASGILLHPTSLPGPHGIGDLGPSAYHFVDWLVAAGQRLWQVLPLNPIGPGNSPYASVSVFAGSPLLVGLEPLIEAGWLAPIPSEELRFDAHRVDYERVIPWRMAKLREAARGFFARAEPSARAQFEQYVAAEAGWLEDYALFMALDAHFSEIDAWQRWPTELARREPEALAAARAQYGDELQFWRFVQWCFDRQWASVKRYANERGVRIIGDLPIFVAGHGADIWSRPELYLLDDALEQAVVAGVPPDFFSKTGQRWGNPLYDWAAMAKEGYAWWIARVRRQLALADIVRIDHFRGFSAYWEIPASSELATEGRWVPGPGPALFEALRAALGELPVIAEDLGIITEEVEQLRDQFELPGMKIVQFGFSGEADHPFLPHNYPVNCVVYTGTHDNDTIRGWYASASERERAFAREYLNCDEGNLPWSMIRAASSSVAKYAIYSMQDLLGLGSEHRMNRPGEAQRCWAWRFVWDMVGPEPARWLGRVSAAHGRADFARLGLGG
ncbi:MAG: 4-alpha-glucanotransferase [Enhygromyxa sp.]